MQLFYMLLVAIHMVAVVVTGVMWAVIDVRPETNLKRHFRDIRAVHFGSLYLIPWFLGLRYAFVTLEVPTAHQVVFPAGLALLVLFSGTGYLLPLPEGIRDPFYFWTKGTPLILASIGMACLGIALFWTAAVLVVYAWRF